MDDCCVAGFGGLNAPRSLDALSYILVFHSGVGK